MISDLELLVREPTVPIFAAIAAMSISAFVSPAYMSAHSTRSYRPIKLTDQSEA